jgi:hypothetical protein
MNGVEYYRDRRVDRSQYKGLSFRLRDGVLELAVKTLVPACAAGGPSPGGVGCRRAHAGLYNPEVECRPDGYSAAYAPCDRRHAPAMCNDGMAHANDRAYERNRRSLSSVVPGSKRNRELMYADQ